MRFRSLEEKKLEGLESAPLSHEFMSAGEGLGVRRLDQRSNKC